MKNLIRSFALWLLRNESVLLNVDFDGIITPKRVPCTMIGVEFIPQRADTEGDAKR